MMKRTKDGPRDWALESSGQGSRAARREEEAIEAQKTPSAIDRQEEMDADPKYNKTKNADMGALIQSIKDQRDALFADTYRDERENEMLTEQILRLEAQQAEVKDRLEKRHKLCAELDKTQKLCRQSYDKLMESARHLQD